VIAYLVAPFEEQRSADAGTEGLPQTVETPAAARLAKGGIGEAYGAAFGAILHRPDGYALPGASRGPMER